MFFLFGAVGEFFNKFDQDHIKFLNIDKILDRDARTVIA
jgi:hypothetical protein